VALLLIGLTYISFDKPYFTVRMLEEYTDSFTVQHVFGD
jgi:hypothetical protein